MCKNGSDKKEVLIVDERGRTLELPDRTPTYCIRCGMRKTQVHGLWCCDCWQVLEADARIDWAQLTRAQFEQYARER